MEAMREKEKSNIWNVPNQNKYGTINAVMNNISNLVTFPCKNISKGNDDVSEKTSMGSDPLKICSLKRNSWMFGRFQRKLVNESLHTFASLQASASGSENKQVGVKKSKEYRSVIQVCLSEMNEHLEALMTNKSTPFTEDSSALKIDCQLLYKMELILGLVEIVFIENLPGESIVSPLLNWIRLHFPMSRQRLSEALKLEQPSSYQYYWDTVFGLVLQGLQDEARNLLSNHPDSNTDAFLSMEEILRKMPVFYAYSGVSESEFNIRWSHWQSECHARLENGHFLHCHQLQTVAKILTGDQETMLSFADILDTWYSLMSSELLYNQPTAKRHSLAASANDAICAFGKNLNVTHLDQLLLAVFQMDSHQVLKECQSVVNNLWFGSHLADLLFHSSDKESDKRYLKDIREALLVDYGWELISHQSLWQVGLLYLEASDPSSSRPWLELALERVPLTSDSKAFKVIREATSRNMDSVAMGVCRVMGRRKLKMGHLGSALWWGVRSRDSAFTSHLAHQVLQSYVEDGQLVSSSSLLDHLGPSMQLSDALIFLSKYREFHMLYQNGEINEGAKLLVSLIASRLAPEYFWPVLLEDALPLLQSPEPVISVDDTYKLMYCLQSISISQADSEIALDKKRKLYSGFLDKESSIRLALTNNLARAILHEGAATTLQL